METFVVVVIYFVIIASFAFDWWLSQLNYNHRNANIPEVISDIYDEDAYKKWQAYSMDNHRFAKIGKIITTLLFLILLATQLFVVFQRWAEQLIPNDVALQVVLFIAPYYLLSLLVSYPLSYYQTFVIEEKYGFNKSTKKTFILDKIKGFLLTVIFGGGLLYLIAKIKINVSSGSMFFLVTWLSIVLIYLIVNIIYVPVLVPLFNKLTPLEEGELKDKIIALANDVGYEIKKISVMDASRRSTKLNAFFSGFGRFKNIVLFDTLIEKMSNDEIVAVLAHEIGHSKHKHVVFNLFQTAVMLSLFIGLFMIILNVTIFSTAFGFSGTNIGFSLILFMILIEPFSIVIGLVTSGFSRKHEYQADAYAAKHVSKDAMISALKVIGKENFVNLTPHPLFVKLRYSHPPIASRIEAILNL